MQCNELNRAWMKQAQLDAERGLAECRLCKQKTGIDETTSLWRNGILVFVICDDCSSSHDVIMRPTEKGVEVRALPRMPLIVRNCC